MNKERKKIMWMFILGVVLMISVLAVQFIQSGQVVHDPMETMDDTMSMVMSDDEMGDNAMEEDVMEKDDEMMEETIMNEGPMAPEFSLMDLEDNTVTLSALKGEKVYVKFWASWCSICLSGLDELDTLAGEMKDFKVVTIVAPGYNGEQSANDFKEWFKTRETDNLIVLLDEDGMITKEFGVRGYPTSALIGSDGILVHQVPGHVDTGQIIEFFKSIQ